MVGMADKMERTMKKRALKLEFYEGQVSCPRVAQETNHPSKKYCHVGDHIIISYVLEVLH
jgi:hypothetical protein